MKESVIHPSSRNGSAQPRTTSAKQVSMRISNRRALWRIERVTRRPSSGRMPRGSGDHQASIPGRPRASIGKMPRRYAATSVAGSRSPPVMIRSSSGHEGTGGNVQMHRPGDCGAADQSVTDKAIFPRLIDKITSRMPFSVIEGGSVLLLLSVFFAYLLAPAVPPVRRRVRLGRRRRPASDAVAIALLYLIVFVPAAIVWRGSANRVSPWVHLTAPDALDHLFRGGEFTPLTRIIARAPLSPGTRNTLARRLDSGIRYIERETRQGLDDLLAAAPYAPWLTVAPVLAFLF